MERVYDTDLTQNAVALVPEHEMLTVDSVKKERILTLDIIRVIAVISVISVHFFLKNCRYIGLYISLFYDRIN